MKVGFPRRVLLGVRKLASPKYRALRNKEIIDKLENITNFTIFSNNCLGGVFYHDAGREFSSPLINVALDGDDFLKFLENPEYYLNCKLEFFCWPGRDFPIARLDDIEVNFVHYKTQEECIEKWENRKKRIIWDNIFVIATDQDGLGTDECLRRFDKLPYANKIMFVANEHPEYEWTVPIKQFKNRFQCRITTSFADMRGRRYYETAFDIASWISSNSNKKYKIIEGKYEGNTN